MHLQIQETPPTIPEDISPSSVAHQQSPSKSSTSFECKYKRRRRRNTTTIVLMNSCWIPTMMMLSLFSARVGASLSRHHHQSCSRTSSSCAFLYNRLTQNNRQNTRHHILDTNKNNNNLGISSSTTRMNSSKHQIEEDPSSFSLSGYQRPKVNWYPGHIAKAERQLSETLKSVDVVIEVRDARAPKATAHPSVGKWAAGRPRVVVLTRVDTVSNKSRDSWKRAYEYYGADRWEERLGGEEKNRNVQLSKERSKYDNGEVAAGGSNSGVEEILFVDAKRGGGTHAISRAVYKAGQHVNERRRRRGLNDRSLRVGIIGFPNIGKSALINRLLGRKRARTANTPGITRSLQWIRVATDRSTSASGSGATNNRGVNSRKKGFELLDSPGIIPSDMLDQNDALLLAACNSVGVGAYDNQAVAAYLCDRIQSLVLMEKGDVAAPAWRNKCIERYKFDPIRPLSEQNIAARWGSESTDGSSSTWVAFAAANHDRIPTGEDMLFIVADNTCQGDPENAARKILQDFRMGRMGPVALQLAPESEEDDGQTFIDNQRADGLDVRVVSSPAGLKRAIDEEEQREKEEIEQRAKAAQVAAKEKGLELPPVMEEQEDEEEDIDKPAESDIGKGMFDGW